jgi:hypothetical protein
MAKTGNKYTFFQRYGLLFLIDSGMSRGINGSDNTGGALRIRDKTKATIICADGTKKELWNKLWDKKKSDHQTKDCGEDEDE